MALNFKKEVEKKNTPRIYLYHRIRKLSSLLSACIELDEKKVVFFRSFILTILIRLSFSFVRRSTSAQKKTSYGQLKAVLVKIVSRTTYQISKKGKRIRFFLSLPVNRIFGTKFSVFLAKVVYSTKKKLYISTLQSN